MSLLIAAMIATAAMPDTPQWRTFHRQRAGWADSDVQLDERSIERRGQFVQVWITHELHLSGLPNPRYYERIRINCARRTARMVRAEVVQQGFGRRDLRPDAGATSIEQGSMEAALADEVCRAPNS